MRTSLAPLWGLVLVSLLSACGDDNDAGGGTNNGGDANNSVNNAANNSNNGENNADPNNSDNNADPNNSDNSNNPNNANNPNNSNNPNNANNSNNANNPNNSGSCNPSGSPRWERPAGFASLSFVVDDSANRTYRDGQMEWNGSFVYDEITNTVAFASSWLPEEGPFPPLYDDGPISLGGHEAEGQTGCDGKFSAQVYFDAAEETTFEYGLINEFDNWIWVGANGQVTVPAGSSEDFEVQGLTIPAFGDVDLKVTLDVAELHPDYASFDPTLDALYLKGSMISWKPVQLLDNGAKGDEAAGDGVYTFQLSQYLGPHDGLLRPNQEVQFVFVFFDAQGLEYKKDGDALPDGVQAFTTTDPNDPSAFVEEEIVLLPESRGNALNTTVIVDDNGGANNNGNNNGNNNNGNNNNGNNNNGNNNTPPECVPGCADDETCQDGVCVPDGPGPVEGAPEVLFVEPSRGPANGGNPVTVTGANFADDAEVYFGGSAATQVEVQNASTLTCVAPAGALGAVTVRVVNGDGSEGEYPRAYTYVDAASGPRIDAVEPGRGSENGGTRVAVRGANFQQGATVRFGDNLGRDVAVAQNGQQIEVTTPSGRVGVAPVTVTNPDQQSVTRQSGFTYETEGVDWGNLQYPPTMRVAQGQESDYIYGQVYEGGVTDVQNGQGDLRAQIGYGPDGSDPSASEDWEWSDAEYNTQAGNNEEYKARVTVAEAGSYDVAYRYSLDGRAWLYADQDGAGNGYSPGQSMSLVVFAVDQSTPQLNSAEPAACLASEGCTVTLRGSNFREGARVVLGTQELTPTTVTATAITVEVPAGAPGWRDVSVVQLDNRRGTLPNGFVYLAAEARNTQASTWGPNELKSIQATYDGDNLYLWIEGRTERGNGVALYLDTDFGQATGITNLSGEGEGSLGDNDGSVDQLLNGALGLAVQGFGAEWCFGALGPDGAPGLRGSESGFNDLVGWRQVYTSANPGLAGNFAWINTSEAPAQLQPDGRLLLRISWDTLYGSGGRPNGARLALFVRLTNQASTVYNNGQTLPMDNPQDPSRVGAVLVLE